MVCARLNFFKIFIFIFSPRRSRRGTLGISSPGGPVEEPLKPFCSFFSLCRLSSSVVFQWGSLRQTLDLSKTTNEKVPWRRPSIYIMWYWGWCILRFTGSSWITINWNLAMALGTRRSWSLDAVSTVLPLGAKSTSTTASACPDKIRKHLPVTQPKLQTDRLKVWDTFYDQENPGLSACCANAADKLDSWRDVAQDLTLLCLCTLWKSLKTPRFKHTNKAAMPWFITNLF